MKLKSLCYEKKINKIFETFFRVIEATKEIDKKPRRFGTDVDLYRSELDVIEHIHENDTLNLTEISKIKRITKGAVSQIAKRLVKKGLAVKYHEENNKKEVFLKLTIKGEIVFHQHETFMLNYAKDFIEFIENTPLEKLEFLEEFFLHIEKTANKLMKIK